VVYKNHVKITKAIYLYNNNLIDKNLYNFRINYDDAEGYFKTFLRVWDWGCYHILSKDKFNLIKDYLK
jgi:hypothetical protein